MFDRWNFTVCSVTHSIRASSAFEWPSATSCRISSSLRVCPGGERRLDVLRVVVHGEHDRPEPGVALTGLAQKREAVDLAVAHLDARDEEVRVELLDEREGRRGRRRLGDDLDVDASDHLRDGVEPERVLVHEDRGTTVRSTHRKGRLSIGVAADLLGVPHTSMEVKGRNLYESVEKQRNSP